MTRVLPTRGNNLYATLSNDPLPIHKNTIDDAIVNEVNAIKLNIDGKDRDSSYYKNPYSFIVTMGRYGTSPSPHLEQSFKNVKYVKINYLILPRYILYDVTYSGNDRTYSPNTNGTILEQYRFIMLRIKELNNKNSFSTNQDNTNQCFILYRNLYDANSMTDIWYALSPIIIYKQGELKNLNGMTIEILTDSGNILLLNSINNGTVASIPLDDVNGVSGELSNFNLYSPFCEILLNIDVGIFGFDINL